jgi:hypothetical protein
MAIQMDKTSIIVCSVIGSLGLLSAILGFSAEGTKLTVSTADLTAVSCLSFFSLDQLANVIDTHHARARLLNRWIDELRALTLHAYICSHIPYWCTATTASTRRTRRSGSGSAPPSSWWWLRSPSRRWAAAAAAAGPAPSLRRPKGSSASSAPFSHGQ